MLIKFGINLVVFISFNFLLFYHDYCMLSIFNYSYFSKEGVLTFNINANCLILYQSSVVLRWYDESHKLHPIGTEDNFLFQLELRW